MILYSTRNNRVPLVLGFFYEKKKSGDDSPCSDKYKTWTVKGSFLTFKYHSILYKKNKMAYLKPFILCQELDN